ncbi:hypothetical protein C8J57DRAFT_1508602 [Mycena rebaudengoi]|nr:hypothetical protein C8J57DRAFT_1508602 [Mycena rebaudengoi]
MSRPTYYDKNQLAPPKITNPIFSCPQLGCRRKLELKLCVSGRNSDRYYLSCFNHKHPDSAEFWHFFAAGDSPAPSTAACLMHRPQVQVDTQKIECSANCKCDGRVNKLCARKLCRAHCLGRGGFHYHVPEAAEASRQLPPIAGVSLKVLQDIEAFSMSAHEGSEQHAHCTTTSLSDSDCLAQEWSDYQYAQQLSHDLSNDLAPLPHPSLLLSSPSTLRDPQALR